MSGQSGRFRVNTVSGLSGLSGPVRARPALVDGFSRTLRLEETSLQVDHPSQNTCRQGHRERSHRPRLAPYIFSLFSLWLLTWAARVDNDPSTLPFGSSRFFIARFVASLFGPWLGFEPRLTSTPTRESFLRFGEFPWLDWQRCFPLLGMEDRDVLGLRKGLNKSPQAVLSRTPTSVF